MVPRRARRPWLLAVGTVLSLWASPLAIASSGGMSYEKPPAVTSASCSTGERWSCHPQTSLTLRGDDLDTVKSVEFLGHTGKADDRRATPVRASAHRLIVIVPVAATSGPLRARTASASARSKRALRISPADSAAAAPMDASGAGTFPIRGKHDMGQSATNNFGGQRNHGGQDMFAACGTPLVAVRDTKVQYAAFQDRAGNYLVLQDAQGQSYVYMHMLRPALVRRGQTVRQGQQVGLVGETGRATGCHLHFELWTAPGWYTGGSAIDPLSQLRAWEASPHTHN